MKHSRGLTIGLIVLAVLTFIWVSGTAVAYQAPEPPNGRLIIKEGFIQLMVTDTEDAKATLEQLAESYGAYIITQRVWEDGDRNQYASYEFGLPADQFETMFTSVKVLGTVMEANSNGREVTDSAIDLTSQLQNLYANQTRLQSFLDDSQTITETLHVHEELIRIESDINELQGQLRGISGRADAALMTVELVPFIPTPTPLPTATPTPLPTPQSWSPGDTAKVASVQLQESVQDTADFAIYRAIVCVPWLFLFLLISIPIYRVYRRRSSRL